MKHTYYSLNIGEPIFVPRHDTQGLRGEDDGVLLSVVLDVSRKTSYLLLLDARDMKEISKAELGNNIVVPMGFHGNFQDQHQPNEYLD
jgi:carotenoid cleavage dioxygenase-like enzyme